MSNSRVSGTFFDIVGTHDDLVLATSIALLWMVRPPSPVATFSYY